MTTTELIKAAEQQITGILAQLEVDTSETVEKIFIDEMDITTTGARRQQCIKQVAIQTKRPVDSRWML